MEKPHNLIIGAGLSGLACAYRLRDCLVLEKEATIGGLCRTVSFNGLRFDLGGHRFFSADPDIENFIRRLLAGHLHEVKRESKIYWNRKFIDYPLKKSVILKLTPWQAALCLLSYLNRKIRPVKEESFCGRATNRFGDELYRLFLRNYTQKVWGLACEGLSKELVDIRLQNVSLLKALKYAFRKDLKTRSFADKFLYPDKGICRIPEFLAEGIPVKLNSEVTGIQATGNRIERILVNGQEGLECRNLISTMPLTELISLLKPPEDVRSAAANLRYRSIIFVFLVLHKGRYSENHWIYFPGQEVFGRIHEPKNWSPEMSPTAQTGLCLEIFCDEHDNLWAMNDAEIAHQAIRDLPLVNKFDVVEHAVMRVKYAYPVYSKGYNANLEVINRYLTRFENLHVLGRTGTFRYVNMDTCLEQGLRLGSILEERISRQDEAACHS